MSDSESTCTSPTPATAAAATPGSKPSTKRCNKPEMERKRRERINTSLNVLKQLVLEALKKDTSQYSKLEKADILEMTVRHLRDLQRHQLVSAASTDAGVVGKYRAGFTECASEVTRYLSNVDGLRPDVRDRLMMHLNGCVQRVHTGNAEPATAHYTAPAAATTSAAVNVVPVAFQQQSPPTAAATSAHPATRPIQIQIPVATSPASLPGAGVQALQLAVATSGAPSAAMQYSAQRASPPHQQPTPPPSQPGSPVHQAVSYSPVNSTGAPPTTAYIGAFQVIPSGAAPTATFMLPAGAATTTATPIYTVNASPVQQAQLQQIILSQMAANHATPSAAPSSSSGSPTCSMTPPPPACSTASSVAPSSVSRKRRAADADLYQHNSHVAAKKMMVAAPPVCVNAHSGVKVNAINEEQVWRPW